MPKTIQAEGLGTVQFPDDFTDEEISASLNREYQKQDLAKAAQPSLASEVERGAMTTWGAMGDVLQGAFKAVNKGARAFPALTADVAEGWGPGGAELASSLAQGDPWQVAVTKAQAAEIATQEAQTAAHVEGPGGFRNLKAWWDNQPLPGYEETKAEPGVAGVGAQVSEQGADLLGRILLMRAAAPVGTSAGGAVAFGSTEKGFSGLNAALGAALPEVQKAGKLASGYMLAKVGGANLPRWAAKALEETGGLAAIQAANEAISIPENKRLLKEDPEAFWRKVQADTIVNLGFLGLTSPTWGGAVPSVTEGFAPRKVAGPAAVEGGPAEGVPAVAAAPAVMSAAEGLARLRGEGGQRRVLRLPLVDELDTQPVEVQNWLGERAGQVTNENWADMVRQAHEATSVAANAPAAPEEAPTPQEPNVLPGPVAEPVAPAAEEPPQPAPEPEAAPPEQLPPGPVTPPGPIEPAPFADPDVALPLKHAAEGPGLVDANGRPVEQVTDAAGNKRWVASATATAAAPPEEGAARLSVPDAVDEIANLLRAGPVAKKQVGDVLARVYGGSMASGKFDSKQASDITEMAMNRVILQGEGAANLNRATADEARANVLRLKAMLERAPTQTTRTGETDKLQQFSTPPPLAYVANWAAKLGPRDVVLEPSAGVGGLAVFAKAAGAKVIANELSERRSELLGQSGLADHLLNHNAEHLNALMRPQIAEGKLPEPTAVVMNPPFSNAAKSGQKSTLIGAKHVEEGLKLLPEGGRLVAIVGKGMSADASNFKGWWNKISKDYNVRANLGVAGAEYRKYGTSFGNQLIVIDKTPPTGERPVVGQVEKVEDLIPLLERIRNERPGIGGTEPAPAQPSGSQPDVEGWLRAPAEPNPPAGPGAPGQEPRTARPAGRRPGRKGAGGLGTARPGETGSGTEGAGGEPVAGAGAARQPEKGGGLSPSDVEGRAEVAKADGLTLEQFDEGQKQLNEQGVFSEYEPRKVRVKGAQAHPTPLVEPTAMAAVDPVDPSYTPKLPRNVITEGKLSATGIENVVYAGQAHQQLLPNGERMGYFIGDGTGVGKGRQIGGIIMDNWNQGRRRALWVSKSSGLINDAKRDLGDIGFDVGKVIDFWKNGGRNLVGAKDGVAFVPYSSLRQDNPGINPETGELFPPKAAKAAPGAKAEVKKSRMHMLRDWLGPDFEGPIIFDEAHMAGNAIDIKGKRGVKAASEQGRMVLDVQKLYPKARIVYSSATGATDVTNLSYADRLGIWGPGTPFTDKQKFFNEIRTGGLSAMEIVARDLKSMGRYLARTLSFEGVGHRQLVHPLTPEQRGVYDELARAWQFVLQHRDETMARTGAAKDGRARSAANSVFYSAQQRFYNQLLTAMQMPSVMADIKAERSKGNSAVLQLVNTDEAAQTRQIARKAAEAVEGDNYLEDLDLSPREILQQYIANSYPTALYEPVEDEHGNVSWRPVRDSKGNTVDDPEALRRKQELQDKVALLRAPSSPIGMLLDTFGVNNVAEITGRSQRVVQKEQPDGTVKRVLEKNRGDAQRRVEANEFQEGKRHILIFSDAGGTGFSYHASRKAQNQERRIHYLVQAGWRADQAMQGFGRTHRSDQAVAPEYVLPSTDIRGHQRFISTIARRLSELGALTGGERKSAGGEMFDETSNLENQYAEDGVTALFSDLHGGRVPGLDFQDVARKLGYVKQIVDEHTGELRYINTLMDEDTGGLNPDKVPSIQQFLNRILSLEVGEQNLVFDSFLERMRNRIENAKADGSYDPGTQTLKALSIRKVSDETVYKDKNSTAATRLVGIEHDHPTRAMSWADLQSGQPVQSYALNNRSQRLYALKEGPNRTLESGAIVPTWRRIHVGGYDIVPQTDISSDNYTRFNEAGAEALWRQQLDELPKSRTEKDTYVVGAFLPIWDRLKIPDPKIWRVKTDTGEEFLGAHVPARSVDALRMRLGAGGGAQRTPEDVFHGVLDDGGLVALANGWLLKRVRVAGEQRIEVQGPAFGDQREWESHIGGFIERIGWTPRFFLPTNEAAGIESMGKLLAKSPATEGVPQTHEMNGADMADQARALMLERLTPDKVRADGTLKSDHVERVAAMVADPVLKTVAYLHDLVEDSNTSHQEIRSEFGDRVADAIEAETWNKNRESYKEYIERVASNRDATQTKLADLADNISAVQARPTTAAGQAKLNDWLAARQRLTLALSQPKRDYTPTIERQTMPDGSSRNDWRMQQIKRVTNSGARVGVGEQARATFMGGGPGGGKTTILEALADRGEMPEGFMHISADHFKEGREDTGLPPIPEYATLRDARDMRASVVAHKESSLMAKAAMARALEERRYFAYDATMRNAQSDMNYLQAARAKGYRLELRGVTLDIDTAIRRAQERAKRSGRDVPTDEIVNGHAGFARSWDTYWPYVDEAWLYDNSKDGQAPDLIAYKEGNKLVIKNEKAYADFRDRRNADRQTRPQDRAEDSAPEDQRDPAGTRTAQVDPGGVEEDTGEGQGQGKAAGVSDDLAGGLTTHEFSTSGRPTLVSDLQRIRAATAPQTLSDPARFAANLLRQLNARMANEMARADEALRPFRKEFDKTPVPKRWQYDATMPLPRNLAFIEAYETGDVSGLSPRERLAAAEFAKQNSEWLDRVHKLGTGALRVAIENYFPHLWDNPAKARSVFASILGKRPLEGPKSFLKERTYELFREGLAAGLKPVHDNPVDLWLLKKREVERYIVGTDFVKEMRTAKLLRFVHAFTRAPEGYKTVNDRAFEVYAPPTVTIKEAFDAGMREATLAVLEHLGVPHERLVKIGGQRWGYERDVTGQPGTERITTKFAGPDFVMWHELGHALDNRYPDMRPMLMGTEAQRQQVFALRTHGKPLTPDLARVEKLNAELRVLADLRFEGQPITAGQRQAIRSAPEKMAVLLQAYLHAPDKMQQVAPNIKGAFEVWLKAHPELDEINTIRPSLRLGESEAAMPVNGMVKLGNWYMPEQAAGVVNNYLSPGLNTHWWYRTLKESSNLLNGVQLGLSAFHLGFTSLDAATSRLAVAIEDAMRGEVGRAARTLATVPFAPFTNILRGAKLRAEALRPGSTDAETAALVQALEYAGGRIGQDRFWRTEFTRRMQRALHEGTATGYLRGALQAPLALWEQTMRPIMDYVVPRQKLGVFADMAKRELLRLGPGASPADLRETLRKSWDSVDNRMGQIVYDNLFYNRAVKDLALLSFRAYGWQLGKYREGLGAVADVLNAARVATKGQRPEVTHRMAYAMALPIMVGTMGGMAHYLMTGSMPTGMDWFMPRTGDKDRNGNDVRLNFPSYVKDVIAYWRHPLTSVAHSLNPLGSSLFDLLENRDFYDVRIRNPQDPLLQQASDVAQFAAKQFIPFAVGGSAKLKEDASPLQKQILPFFGITPVPSRLTMTPAQELASELMAEQMPQAPRTKEQFDKSQLIKELVADFKSGDAQKKAAARDKFFDGVRRQMLTPESVTTILDKLVYTPLQFQIHMMDVESSMRVWRVANPDEQSKLRTMIALKVETSRVVPLETKAKYLRELTGR